MSRHRGGEANSALRYPNLDTRDNLPSDRFLRTTVFCIFSNRREVVRVAPRLENPAQHRGTYVEISFSLLSMQQKGPTNHRRRLRGSRDDFYPLREDVSVRICFVNMPPGYNPSAREVEFAFGSVDFTTILHKRARPTAPPF